MAKSTWCLINLATWRLIIKFGTVCFSRAFRDVSNCDYRSKPQNMTSSVALRLKSPTLFSKNPAGTVLIQLGADNVVEFDKVDSDFLDYSLDFCLIAFCRNMISFLRTHPIRLRFERFSLSCQLSCRSYRVFLPTAFLRRIVNLLIRKSRHLRSFDVKFGLGKIHSPSHPLLNSGWIVTVFDTMVIFTVKLLGRKTSKEE